MPGIAQTTRASARDGRAAGPVMAGSTGGEITESRRGIA
jgi:hypothetical protein